MSNKVEYGLSNVHYAVGTTSAEGALTFATPKRLPGAVSMDRDRKSDVYEFSADDAIYYSTSTSDGESIKLTMAMFPDDFKKEVLGYIAGTKGGLAEPTTPKTKPIAILFEGKGDQHATRHMFLNCIPGVIEKGFKTLEKGKPEVQVETLTLNFLGMNGHSHIKFIPSDAAYATLFTTAPTFTAVPVV